MEKNSKYREDLKNRKNRYIYQKTDFSEVISPNSRFKLNFSESAMKTDIENAFKFFLKVDSCLPTDIEVNLYEN